MAILIFKAWQVVLLTKTKCSCACNWQPAPPRQVWIYWPNLIKEEVVSKFLFPAGCTEQSRRREETHACPLWGRATTSLGVQGIHLRTASPGAAVEDTKLQWFCCSVICFKDRPEQSFPLTILTGHRGFWNLCIVDFTLIHCKMYYSQTAQ